MLLGLTVEIVEGSAEDIAADVLMIKHALGSSGFETRLRKKLKEDGEPRIADAILNVSEYILVETPPQYPFRYVLTVGSVSIYDLDYAGIRSLGYDMLASLHHEGLPFKHVATTLHGVNTRLGNDEEEAFRSLLLGFADAYEAGQVPPTLERISLVEREGYRVKLLRAALEKFIPSTPDESTLTALRSTANQVEAIISGLDSFDEAYQHPVADESTPHIFVAMPFSDDYDDHYYLAIRPAITENGMLCIRLDQEESTFTGDIMEQVKERIQKARLVVALLDGRNPNVYLEVGYAWGVKTPTILVLHADEDPPFDVRGARLLVYKQMYKLKDQLTQDIRALLAQITQ